jgi:hypothetical protein
VNASKKQGDVLVHSLKAFRRKRGIAPLILDIWHYMKVSGQIHALVALLPEKNISTHCKGC